ncbi:hypothetical protein JMJ77_0015111, partial [Colletotrichum scovillei]
AAYQWTARGLGCVCVRRPRLSPSLAPPDFFWARLTPFQTTGACDKPPPPHFNFTNCLSRRRLRGSIRLLSSPGPFPSLPATPAYDSTYLVTSLPSTVYGVMGFGLLPPTQLSITNTTPRRAPFASHAIPLRAPADRLDLPVGTACLHLKLLGALQTSDGPSFGAKSQRLPEPRLMF